jgi:undecaprenyl phosphate-alpha-L-ara4FN deformylase
MDEKAIAVLKGYPFAYLSCTRSRSPFVHEELGKPEVPSDLPCFEELGVEEGVRMIIKSLQAGGVHVLPVHAEVEGGIWLEPFIDLMKHIKNTDYQFDILGEIARNTDLEGLPRRGYRMALLPGRSTPCCV